MDSVKSYANEDHLTEDLTLSEIVTKNSRAANVFEKYNLDFCCGGSKLFSAACSEKGLDTAVIAKELKNTGASDLNNSARFEEWELDFLVDYIVNNHHGYVRRMIPSISTHAEKVASAHGKNHPETLETAKIFESVQKDLKQHLMKEEQILFPYIKQLVKVKNGISKFERPYFGSVANPIKMMEAEHENAGEGLYEIRKLSGNYTLPEDACATFTALYSELKEFEADLHKHVHLENNILFPKSMELESVLIQQYL